MTDPIPTRFAQNGEARLAWQERGEGSPLLLVMGHSYGSSMWYPARDVLAEQHRVLTFDNRGTGQSSSAGRLTVADMARDAFAVLDAAGVSSAHLYGVSMGGGIILEMARQQPERVRSLVLGCTLAKTPDLPGAPLVLRLLLNLPAPLVLWLVKKLTRRTAKQPYGSRALPGPIARDVEAVAANVGSARTSVAQTKAVGAYTISAAEVQALRMPAIVLHGDEDAVVPYDAGVRLHDLLAHSELVTLQGAGHNYFVAAGDEANAAVLDFLRRVESAESEELVSP